jgi:hypothetical protein
MPKKKKYLPRNLYLVGVSRGEKCPYCSGRNGEAKDVYVTQEVAEDMARHIESEHRIRLKVYPCPHSDGWHLTRIDDDTDSLVPGVSFPDRDIPRRSSKNDAVSWVFEPSPEPAPMYGSTHDESAAQKPPLQEKRAATPIVPIVKIECKSGLEELAIYGRITEVAENIDIAIYFGVNIDNPFAAVMIKELLNKSILQITLHTAIGKGQTGSYTVLIDRTLFKQNNMAKGGNVGLSIKARIVNGRKAWYCNGLSAIHAGNKK